MLIKHLQRSNLKSEHCFGCSSPYNGPDSFHLSEEYRLEVLTYAINTYVQILHYSVEQNDFASRNIIVSSKNTSTDTDTTGTSIPIPRVTLINYNAAIVYSCTRCGRSVEESLALPVNPIQWFWKQSLGGDFPG